MSSHYQSKLAGLLSLLIVSQTPMPAIAAGSASDLAPLEDKFFAHPYDKEPVADRLNRLEKLVFGNTQSGSTEERIARLSSTVTGASVPSNSPAPAHKQVAKVDEAVIAAAKAAAVADTYDYPAVAQLERSILGRNYKGEPVQQRLNRLEGKAFGAPSKVVDMASRVDKLESYASVYGVQPGDDKLVAANQRNNAYNGLNSSSGAYGWNGSGNSSSNANGWSGSNSVGSSGSYGWNGANAGNSFAGSRGANAGNSFAGSRGPNSYASASNPYGGSTIASNPGSTSYAGSGGNGMLERVGVMETKVFGSQSTNKPLAHRIKELESKVYGKPLSHDDDMTGRVDKLWAAVQTNVAGSGAIASNQNAAAPFSSGKHKSKNGIGAQQPWPADPSQANNGYADSFNNSTTAYNPAAGGYGAGSSYSSNGAFYGSTNKHHKQNSQFQSQSHGSLLGKLGKVVVFAGSTAVGAGALAAGAVGGGGYSGYGGGYGGYRSYSPGFGYGSFGSSIGSSYGGSFYSR